MEQLTLQRVDERTVAYVESLLSGNSLPSKDVREKPECFYIGYHGNDRVGIGGIERNDSAGLLRSIVVERSVREQGFGTAICQRLETTARTEGVKTLYLLTTTASDFFESRGYGKIDRSDVPPSIQETSEFSDFCSASATCMRKVL